MLKIALEEANHVEDYNNLVEGLSPSCDITTINSVENCKGIKVGIIGGGIAGLVSAFELRKLGFNITIIETDNNRIEAEFIPIILIRKRNCMENLEL